MTELGVFAKYWLPGQVKTRLAKDLGEDATVRIYQVFLSCIARRFREMGDRRRFIVTPPEYREAFQRFLPDDQWSFGIQSPGSLGDRMRAYFDETLARFDRAVLIGSDCPHLPVQFVTQAFERLESSDVVIGPTHDGGYYLLGAARRTPPVFEGIEWSTHRVWDQTRRKLIEQGLSFAVLPTSYDIDTHEDLKRLVHDLQRGTEICEPRSSEIGLDALLTALSAVLDFD